MSTSRRCDYVKCTDGQWYLWLGDFEHADDDDDCTVYGPFDNEKAISEYIRACHSNPGGYCLDDSGEETPPEKPVRPRRSFW